MEKMRADKIHEEDEMCLDHLEDISQKMKSIQDRYKKTLEDVKQDRKVYFQKV